jgi:hypothetical protein
MTRNIFSLFFALFTLGCGEIPQGQDDIPLPSSPKLSVTTTESSNTACQCPATTLPDGTNLASLMQMGSDGVLHFKVPVSIEVADTATALSLSGGRIGLDVTALEIGVRSVISSTDVDESYAFYAYNETGTALYAQCNRAGIGVHAVSMSGSGLRAEGGWAAVDATAIGTGMGVRSEATSGTALAGFSSTGYGAYVYSEGAEGIYVQGATYGLYTPNSIRADGGMEVGDSAKSCPNQNVASAGWLECPETGECACPEGQYVAKTADRGARIFCAKL